jgi:hypothetical protein
MMIYNYSSITKDSERKEYKQVLDEYFGHGSAATTLIKRHAMLSLALSQGGEDQTFEWFADQHERRFFIRCMTLISKHNKAEEEEEDCGAFEGEINDDNPALWQLIKGKRQKSPDEDTDDMSGTYIQGKATKADQKSVPGSRKRPPAITHQSVIAILQKSISEL